MAKSAVALGNDYEDSEFSVPYEHFAGARWVDEQVVVDRNLITSRKPADLEPFCNTLDEYLAAA